jgi:dolichyl-phosphate-mannose-protein mannosyltransferase
MARISALIILPFLVYAACFKIHFLILNRSGPGDAQMSSLFQAHLRGIDFAESPLEIAYGSKVTLKNYGYGGGLLHSHVQTMPVGSQQQQITCYHYKDDNNHWRITPTWGADPVDPDGPVKFLLDGDTIRLVHTSTGRNLHSHVIAAPVTKEHWEVSGYGNETIGDEGDHWVVEVVDDTHRSRSDAKDGRVHSLTTRMRFRHKLLNCYLRAANSVLPQWGFKQVEVTCDKENNPKDVHTYWNVESHWNERCRSFHPKTSCLS